MIYAPPFNSAQLAFWQWTKVILVPPIGDVGLAWQRRRPSGPRVHPGGLLVGVVDEEHASVGSHLEENKRTPLKLKDHLQRNLSN